jgi:NAD(P)-dependent dehydrogenase (short-subunit alcohol dehydrogenase family)
VTTYLVTGGTGFIGGYLVAELLKRDGDIVVLARASSRPKVDAMLAGTPGAAGRVRQLVGDIASPGLGLSESDTEMLRGVELFHMAAVYDIEASEAANRLANVDGTRHVVDLANRAQVARLHHMSTFAIAGHRFKGEWREEMFDEGQELDLPYYRTKFEAERIVREECRVPWRVYRPGFVMGSSETGQADRADGPYFTFKLIQKLGDALPSWFPLVGLEGGRINIVPVDFVARAVDHIAHRPGLDGKVFAILDPHPLSVGDTLNEFCRVARAPQFTLRVDRRALDMAPKGMTDMLSAWPALQTLRRQVRGALRLPDEAFAYMNITTRFSSANTQAALEGSGIHCPPLHTYSWKLWDYWARHLDREAPTPANLRAVLEDQVVVVTGASSGIGRAAAEHLARHGARVMLVSRSREKLDELRSDIEGQGGRGWVYPTDLSDLAASERMIHRVLQEHGRVDVLINNAGRSIRRSVTEEIDRFHDFERTMQLNYFGALKLILAVLPGMRERGHGHIINISSIGTQAYPPRFGAYVASKSALAALGRCLAPEVADDGVAVTNIHMPLVRTPMIAPTGIYKNFPTISPDEAAELVLNAILTRPPEVSTRLGKLGEVIDTIAPGFLNLVMTGAYHVFPETAGKSPEPGADGDGRRPEGEEMSAEASVLAYLMRGIHF